MVQANNVTTRLSRLVISKNIERPKRTPSADRHHTNSEVRSSCGYTAPSGGNRPGTLSVRGAKSRASCWRRSGAVDSATAGEGGTCRSIEPARTAGLPDRRAAGALDPDRGPGFLDGSGMSTFVGQDRLCSAQPRHRRVPAEQFQRLEQRWRDTSACDGRPYRSECQPGLQS